MREEKDDAVDSYKYAVVRQKILEQLRKDLIGPMKKEEKLKDPAKAYITGKLYPSDPQIKSDEGPNSSIYQSVCGLYFYLKSDVKKIQFKMTWGEYIKDSKVYKRRQREFSNEILIAEWIPGTGEAEIMLPGGEAVIHITAQESEAIRDGYQMIFVSVRNIKNHSSKKTDECEQIMFQVQIELSAPDGSAIFVPEYLCRQEFSEDDYLYAKRPIYARGFGCAAIWKTEEGRTDRGQKAVSVRTSFIPECEIHNVDYTIDSLEAAWGDIKNIPQKITEDKSWLCMKHLANPEGEAEYGKENYGIPILKKMAEEYEAWIAGLEDLGSDIGPELLPIEKRENIIQKHKVALARIRAGIEILVDNEKAWDAFSFMNEVMYKQRAMAQFAKRKEDNERKEWSLEDFYEEDRTNWRPFQIAFILLNIKGITCPEDEDRECVDLLYFPTGGGKTEAYLGLIAFTMAYRRLTSEEDDIYEHDGGVTAILRYTLRMLSKQQRDRVSLMILAAESVRGEKTDSDGSPTFGEQEFSIGFWVGSGVTPNSLEFNKRGDNKGFVKDDHWEKIHKQLKTCPCCGAALKKEDFNFDEVRKAKNKWLELSLLARCPDEGCVFHGGLPIYLVDDDIYRERPTVVIATIDKFAMIARSGEPRAIFGMRDSEEKNYYPPELIIQDELHLISGSLGSIYGGYEALVEELCTAWENDKILQPKYVAFTATIENAKEQIHSLYGRSEYFRFPPEGFETNEAYFIQEIALPTVPYDSLDIPEKKEINESEIQSILQKDREAGVKKTPFRQYVGVCGNGISTQETMGRVYASVLQSVNELIKSNDYKNYVDPYYTLIGYFNTIREFGSAVWMLEDEDEIPGLIEEFAKKNDSEPARVIKEMTEITSKLESEEIAEILHALETGFKAANTSGDAAGDTGEDTLDDDSDDTFDHDSNVPFDVALATNMISVGVDIDRLGLMVSTRPPYSDSEYIQATSRVGRKNPGFVVTVYNPNQNRNMSYYEDFVGFHSQMYRYVEGTTAVPFAEQAWGRILHALAVGWLRLNNEMMCGPDRADNIVDLQRDEVDEVIQLLGVRIGKAIIPFPEENDPILKAARDRMFCFVKGWHTLALSHGMHYPSDIGLPYFKSDKDLNDSKDSKDSKDSEDEDSEFNKTLLVNHGDVESDGLYPPGNDSDGDPLPVPTLTSMRNTQPTMRIDLCMEEWKQWDNMN